MMREQYWGLFWTTGMPEAWLMSRNQLGAARADAGLGVEGPWGLSGPPSGVQPDDFEDGSGNPRGSI